MARSFSAYIRDDADADHFSRRVSDCDEDQTDGSVTVERAGWSAAGGRKCVYVCTG